MDLDTLALIHLVGAGQGFFLALILAVRKQNTQARRRKDPGALADFAGPGGCYTGFVGPVALFRAPLKSPLFYHSSALRKCNGGKQS